MREKPDHRRTAEQKDPVATFSTPAMNGNDVFFIKIEKCACLLGEYHESLQPTNVVVMHRNLANLIIE